MSVRHRQRIRCSQCSATCRTNPTEVMVRGGRGWRGHWMWYQLRICDGCQLVLLELVGQQAERKELDQRNGSSSPAEALNIAWDVSASALPAT